MDAIILLLITMVSLRLCGPVAYVCCNCANGTFWRVFTGISKCGCGRIMLFYDYVALVFLNCLERLLS